MSEQRTFDWIEIIPRPLKDGLHDSGYRFLRTIGGVVGGDPVEMHEWADHVQFQGAVNIDVTRAGVLRVMGRMGGGGWKEPKHLYVSDGEFFPSDMPAAMNYLQTSYRIERSSQ